ncbi:MAG: hypothetical protein MUF36_10250 [Bacteroidales bacterium]|jgi:hypothetical protein|nr:hypothetical protein [Bacteroidales bacterium]
MNLTGRIESFSILGSILRNAVEGKTSSYTSGLKRLIDNQHLKNPWFIPGNVTMAVSAIANELTAENLKKWTDAYPDLKRNYPPLRVAVIMAGNIPLVGFHDFLTVLITGNNIVAKTSSKDADLMRFIGDILCDIDPVFRKRIEFSDGAVSGFDAVIATGSDNTSRYFEQYFGKYPHIIRRNRNSIAILDGTESDQQLDALGADVFSYFGLGCRNVSKLYVPSGYNFARLINNWKKYSDLVNHPKYANNYDFSKAVFIVNKENFIDTGFVLIKEDSGHASPVAVLWYEYFKSPDQINNIAEELNEKIQCIIGKNHLSFGTAQSPALWDYADGTDTVEFLLKKNIAGIL